MPNPVSILMLFLIVISLKLWAKNRFSAVARASRARQGYAKRQCCSACGIDAFSINARKIWKSKMWYENVSAKYVSHLSFYIHTFFLLHFEEKKKWNIHQILFDRKLKNFLKRRSHTACGKQPPKSNACSSGISLEVSKNCLVYFGWLVMSLPGHQTKFSQVPAKFRLSQTTVVMELILHSKVRRSKVYRPNAAATLDCEFQKWIFRSPSLHQKSRAWVGLCPFSLKNDF